MESTCLIMQLTGKTTCGTEYLCGIARGFENTAMHFLDAEAKCNKTSLLVLNTFLYIYPAFFFFL